METRFPRSHSSHVDCGCGPGRGLCTHLQRDYPSHPGRRHRCRDDDPDRHELGFYSQAEAVAAIDANTMFLLMGMMTLVVLLKPTGGFEYLAIRMAKLSAGTRGCC